MGDEFHLGNGNWWETSSRNRYDHSGTSTVPASISTTLNAIASYGSWPTVEVKSRSSVDDGGSNMVLQGGGSNVLANSNLQMMGLGLSSLGMDWNQALISEKSEISYHSMLQEDLTSSNSSSFHQEYSSGVKATSQEHWPRQEKLYSDDSISSLNNDFKQIISQQNLTAPFDELMSPWNKFSQFFKTSQPNTPFWNASTPVTTTLSDSRSSFFQASQTQIPEASSFDEKPKKTSKVQNMGTTMKKNNMEISSKRPRNETYPHLPAFKVRKDKMGDRDRLTALQQLVSPFGKTDTASVLSEAYESIRFLHEQIHMLSTTYMKNGASIHHQQNSNKPKDWDRPRQDLRSRGLCVVPISSTFPMTHETTVDFWTPTFGGTFR